VIPETSPLQNKTDRKKRVPKLPGVKIIRRLGKHSVVDIGRPISRKEIKKALAEFP
jgi:hypothetical protein